ncbi:DNA-dependent protein kinase catalytic subunit-like isoform X2 [Tachypleus tridentatus]|uniref:DNA-dependent protein kinase catalytic subunit-like isoform X2 n=1 Tax=Tachypleus tridentatus TaxID=6853 RepID=UPI003FD0E3C7
MGCLLVLVSFILEKTMKLMQNDMLQRSEHLYFSEEIPLDEKIQTLPSYLEALASIVSHLSEVSETHLERVAKLVVLQIEHYPRLADVHHFLTYRSIIKTLLAFAPKKSIFKRFLGNIIYQGLIRTCSHPVVAEVEARKDEIETYDPRQITYQSYLGLWHAILDIVNSKLPELGTLQVSLAERQSLAENIYDEIIQAIFAVLKKLDLSSSENTVYNEVNTDQVPVEEENSVIGRQDGWPKDHQVFINVVDFTRDLLLKKHLNYFEKWVYTFGMEVIEHATRSPHISGFYKLATVCLKICSRIKYFKNINTLLRPKECESMQVDDPFQNERILSFKLFSKFARDAVISLQQYKDDLLASCLHLVLSLPSEIVLSEISHLVPSLECTFQLGASYLPLATAGLEALEVWSVKLSPEVLEPYYPQILPHLNAYLVGRSASDLDESFEVSLLSRTASKNKYARKFPANFMKKVNKDNQSKIQETEIMVLRLRILKFLGSIGGKNNKALLEKIEEETSEKAISWDNRVQDHLKFAVPFADMKPEICLDNFLPQVVHLACNASDRQTKVAACELFHALVIYMIGISVQQPKEWQKKYPMTKLYQRVFPALLKLACDVDQVARQLFEPLCYQVIHWFTNNRGLMSEETMTLLQALWDAITEREDALIRDFGGKCLKEFVLWSIKQTTPKEQEKSPVNIKALMKRLYSYCLHPNSSKRLGAALAFNHMYAILREEEQLVNMFILETLVHFVNSLAIAHKDEKSLGTQEQCKQTLDHVERILRVRAELLNKPNKQRRQPHCLEGSTLSAAVLWLVQQCGKPQTECRHKCMELVFKLAPCLPGTYTTQEYFHHLLKTKGPQFFINSFENGLKTDGLLEKTFCSSLKLTIDWMEEVLGILDCYTWIFGECLLEPSAIFRAGIGSKGTNIFTSLEFFIFHFTGLEITAANDLLSPKERGEFKRVKCTVIVRFFNFLTVLIRNFSKDLRSCTPQSLWSKSLWKCISLCILDPTSVGFNMTDLEIMTQLPHETTHLLKAFHKLPSPVLQDFTHSLERHIASEEASNLIAMLPLHLGKSNVDHLMLRHLLTGYEQLINCGFWPVGGKKGSSAAFISGELLNAVWKGCVGNIDGSTFVANLNPPTVALMGKLFDVAFLLNTQPDCLIEKLLVTDSVLATKHNTYSRLGLVVFGLFRAKISSYLAKTASTSFSLLIENTKKAPKVVPEIILGVLDFISSNRNIRKEVGTGVVESLFSCWEKLSHWWSNAADEGDLNNTVVLLTKLLIIDPAVVTSCALPYDQSLCSVFINLLTRKGMGLPFVGHVLDLLAYFLKNHDINKEALIRNALNELAANNFPLQSTEFVVSSLRYNNYVTIFRKILTALELSGSLILLTFVVGIMCRETSHLLKDEIQKSIARSVCRLKPEDQVTSMDTLLGMFLHEDQYPAEMKLGIIERVCVPILRVLSKPVLTDFFVKNIHSIMEVVSSKVIKGSEERIKAQLLIKIGAFQLTEVLFSCLPKEVTSSKESLINKAFCDGNVDTGKELTTELTRQSHTTKKEDLRGETTLYDVRRRLSCAAYNVLIAVISCTQSDPKFYNVFLFQENSAKREFIWENIVDLKKEYFFPVELEAPMERKKTFLTIREENKESSGIESNYRSVQYLASQYLADSSLSEDVSRFDFSTSEKMFSTTVGENIARKRSYSSNPEQESQVIVKDDYIELENDDLNSHECMASLSTLLQTMQQKGILASADQKSITAVPKFLEGLYNKLNNPEVHKNIKLFLARLIINNAQDTIIGRHAANSILEFLMTKCAHPRKDIFRNNLEVIKTVVECWKPRLEVPTRIICNQMCMTDITRKENLVGIQLSGIVLANDLSPYSNTAGKSEKARFLNLLASNLTFKYKEVYASASEVIGMVLKYMEEKEGSPDETFQNSVAQHLTELSNSKQDQFITCVNKMHLHFPPIADRFLQKLLFLLPKVHGNFTMLIMEVVGSRVECIQGGFNELKTKGILKMITHRDDLVKKFSLQAIKGLLPQLTLDNFLEVLPMIVKLQSQLNPLIREVMYQIIMDVYANFSMKSGAKEKEITRLAKETLLLGLADQNIALRLLVNNFWSNPSRLPSGTKERFLTLLQQMYSPPTEDKFLEYGTFLLMQLTSLSPDYNRKIFQNPLSDCKFQIYNISSSWRQRHSAMTPMFAETLLPDSTLGSLQTGASGYTHSMSGGQHLRATQANPQFTASMDPGEKPKTYNWLTQSSVNTMEQLGSLEATGATMGSSGSSLLFTVGKKTKVPASNLQTKDGRSLKAVSDEVDSTSDSSSVSDILRLKRRFVKDQERNRLVFVKRAVRLKNMRDDLLKEQRSRREAEVTLYRQYRTGDFPYIEINYSSVIAPLQALAQKDQNVAKTLMSSIAKALCQSEEQNNPHDYVVFCNELNQVFNNILQQTVQFFPPFIGFVEEVSYYNVQHLPLEPEEVSKVSQASGQQNLGILLLEDMLIKSTTEETKHQSKKSRRENRSNSPTTSLWIKLAELYKSLNNYDVVRGIFSNSVNTQTESIQALEFEARGDYTKALQLYIQLYETTVWPDKEPEQAEIDHWDDAIFKCYDSLTQWDALEKAVVCRFTDGQSPNLDRIWEDSYYQEHYLPYMIRSKLKKLLEEGQDQSLLSFFDNSMQDPDKKEYIEEHFTEELALLYVVQEDFDRAQFYSTSCLQNFLQDWSSLSLMTPGVRENKLHTLQKLVELKQFLDFMAEENNFNSVRPVKYLLKQWKLRLPSVTDPLHVWDDIVTNRTMFMEKLREKVVGSVPDQDSAADSSMNTLSQEEISRTALDILEQEFILKLRFVDSLCKQGCTAVASKHIKWLDKMAQNLGNIDHRIAWIHKCCEIYHQRAVMLRGAEKLKILLKGKEQLMKLDDKLAKSNTPEAKIHHSYLHSFNAELIAENLMEDDVSMVSELNYDDQNRLKNIAESTDLSQFIPNFLDISYQYLQKGVNYVTDLQDALHHTQMVSTSVHCTSNPHMSLALFCNKYLRKKEDATEDNWIPNSLPSYPTTLVTSLLTAMRQGSKAAMQLFPRLLQVLELYPRCSEDFVKKTNEIPSWMFIGWINQIVALLDKPEAPPLHGIVERMAKEYPNAIVYPFRLSSKGYEFDNSNLGKRNKAFVEKIESLMGVIPLVDDFIKALGHLSVPVGVFKETCRNITTLKKFKENAEKIQKEFQEMWQELFDTGDQNSSGPGMGLVFINFEQKYKKKVVDLCGQNGSKILSMSTKDFFEKSNCLVEEMKKTCLNVGSVRLKDISLWLSDFHPFKYQDELEIPGQYTGTSKPIPEYHVKVYGFDQGIRILNSITRPRTLTIRGNDEKEYRCLVKAQEDLRQDNRIEHLFSVMNDIYANDPACSCRHLSLATYKVIPLTTRLGLIEWVDNTVVLNQFLEDIYTNNDKERIKQAEKRFHNYMKPLNKSASEVSRNAYRKLGRKETLKAFQEVVDIVPNDIMKRGFMKLSSCPEAFFTLRSQFVISHAVLSISQWLLGIGDRHLGNFLIKTDTGKELGIDFGHAFGSATQFLPVPELVPFRLTPQYLNLMLPLKEKGLYEATMIHALKALQKNRDLLLNFMDVFIKEPTLDWKNWAQKQRNEGKASEDADHDTQWYPKQRVQFAYQKLQGINPCYITMEELTLGHSKSDVFSKIRLTCLGDKEDNIRAKLPKAGLTIEQQVACLIDQATDFNILARIYWGWKQWL